MGNGTVVRTALNIETRWVHFRNIRIIEVASKFVKVAGTSKPLYWYNGIRPRTQRRQWERTSWIQALDRGPAAFQLQPFHVFMYITFFLNCKESVTSGCTPHIPTPSTHSLALRDGAAKFIPVVNLPFSKVNDVSLQGAQRSSWRRCAWRKPHQQQWMLSGLKVYGGEGQDAAFLMSTPIQRSEKYFDKSSQANQRAKKKFCDMQTKSIAFNIMIIFSLVAISSTNEHQRRGIFTTSRVLWFANANGASIAKVTAYV